MRCALVIPMLVLASCGEDEAPVRRAHAAQTSQPGHEGPVANDPAPARFTQVRGTVTVEGAPAGRGSDVEAERRIEVRDGSAVLTLRDGGQIALDAGALAVLLEDGGAQMILLRGGAHAMQPPSGNSPRPPLRIVSPSATIEIGHSGEAYLAVLAGGASWVALLSGAGAVTNGEADAQRRVRALDLAAGQAVAVAARIAEPTEGPTQLEAARSVARALTDDTTAPESERLARQLHDESLRLDQALRWLETETRRGRELTNEHRTAVHDGNTEIATRLQRDLVQHSQQLYRLRRLATERWERLRAQWLRLDLVGTPPADDPVAARRDRIVGLLGL